MKPERTPVRVRMPVSWVWAGVLALVLFVPDFAAASGGNGEGQEKLIRVLLGVSVILFVAKLADHAAELIQVPSVLGELLVGILLGNLWLVGFDGLEFMKHESALDVLAALGVILLLFDIGLKSNMGDMLRVGQSAALVAILGVVAPFVLGVGASMWFLTDSHPIVHFFIGGTLSATSVGITARVLEEGGFIDSNEGRIILGAAVIDDVLGLVVLALLTGAAAAVASGTGLAASDILIVLVKVAAFFAFAGFADLYISARLFYVASLLRGRGLLLATSIFFCFSMAYLATMIGLAPIVGAFAAGLALDKTTYQSFRERSEESIEDLIEPITSFLVPVFFVLMGLRVNVSTLFDPKVLGFAIALSVAAFVGKQVCSFGVMEPGANRLAVGLGMVPRGEVGLIFAGIGSDLMVAGQPVIGPSIYSALVFMVIVTTLVTPPLLMRSLKAGRLAAGPEIMVETDMDR
jgi:Kef-type K+ transport system membrane component KefB